MDLESTMITPRCLPLTAEWGGVHFITIIGEGGGIIWTDFKNIKLELLWGHTNSNVDR